MHKPIKYSYRIQHKIGDVLDGTDKSGKDMFWVEQSSVISSVLDYEWFKCGERYEDRRYDPDWGWYDCSWHETRYFKTSNEAKIWIDEQIARYPKDYEAWEEWSSKEKERAEAEAARVAAETKKKAEFESKNMIGKVFR